MLRSGAETSRVEETIVRLGKASGAHQVHSFVTPTGIFITLHTSSGVITRLQRIWEAPGIHLHKVTEVNDLSRRFERGQYTAEEVMEKLQRLEQEGPIFPLGVTYLAAALSSGGFTIIFGGSWSDFLPGALAGWLANTVMEHLDVRMPRFLAVFFAALTGSMLAAVLVLAGIGIHLEKVILGAVVPLVPGLSITNAVRDLMAGDLLAGVARSAEAILSAFAIAVGVAIVLALQLGGTAP